MKEKKNLILHQKSKSINNNDITLRDLVYNNNKINYNLKPNNYNKTNYIIEENKNKENSMINNLGDTIDDMKQHILDLYYDNNSLFKNKIDNLNLQFYLETEKYLNYNKNNDINRSQKLQANLFMILFKQINIFLEEIERLNKIIIESKYKTETILKRTNDLNEKKNNILIKDNMIQSLKQTNTNTEKKLLETLLHEDKLIKDNERLRKENETYKSLTIAFENELKKNKKCGSSSPFGKNYIKHIKTYSDYGSPSNSIINEIYSRNIDRCETINYENKSPFSDKKIMSINNNRNNRNKELFRNNKFRMINLNYKKLKKKVKNIKAQKNNIIKINNSKQLLRNNTLRENIKISLNKASLNYKQKNKKIQDYKNEEIMNNKNQAKKEISCSNKFRLNNSNNKYRILISHNLGNNNSCNNKKVTKKNKTIKTKNKNLKLNLNNINSAININMTESNNNFSFDKEKNKNCMKLRTQIGYGPSQKRTMSEVSYTETGKRVEVINDELNNSNHIQAQNTNKAKAPNNHFKKILSNHIEENINNRKIGKNIIIQDSNYNNYNTKNIYNVRLTDDKKYQKK
jgi:hypothetical protein